MCISAIYTSTGWHDWWRIVFLAARDMLPSYAGRGKKLRVSFLLWFLHAFYPWNCYRNYCYFYTCHTDIRYIYPVRTVIIAESMLLLFLFLLFRARNWFVFVFLFGNCSWDRSALIWFNFDMVSLALMGSG